MNRNLIMSAVIDEKQKNQETIGISGQRDN